MTTIANRSAEKIDLIRAAMVDLPEVAGLDDEHISALLASNENSPKRVIKVLRDGIAAAASAVKEAAAPKGGDKVEGSAEVEAPAAEVAKPAEPARNKNGQIIWPDDMPYATIRKADLAAALKCAGKADIRYYLNGVLVEVTTSGRAYVVGTNGHMMAVIDAGYQPEPAAGLQDLVIPRASIEAALKAGDKKRTALIIRRKGGEWRIGDGENEITFEPVGGRFPEWRLVLPIKCSDIVDTLRQVNQDLIAIGCEALQLHAGNKKLTPHVSYANAADQYGALVMRLLEGAVIVVISLRITADYTPPALLTPCPK